MCRTRLTIDCGYMNWIDLETNKDNSISMYHRDRKYTFTNWTFAKLDNAADYVALFKDYDRAERAFIGAMYRQSCLPARYPVPAKPMRTFENWRKLGEVSALNNFDIDVVLALNRYR